MSLEARNHKKKDNNRERSPMPKAGKS